MEREDLIQNLNKKPFLKGLDKYRNLIGIICLIMLVPFVIFNVTVLIVNIATDGAPSFFGVTPILQLSTAMDGSGVAEKGDMVFIKKTDASLLKEGDVIGYRIGETVYIRRIIAVSKKNQENVFVTKGDNNKRRDNANVSESQIIGVVNTSVKKLGNFVEFARSPIGIALLIGCPLSAYLLFDIITSVLYNRKLKKSNDEKLDKKFLDENLKEKNPKADQNINEETTTEEKIGKEKTKTLELIESNITNI